jgi:hypothetical protein
VATAFEAATATKVCRECGEKKPLDAFHRNPQARDGRHPRCADCKNGYFKRRYAGFTDEQRANFNAVSRYGVTLDEIRALYEMQAGCCAICEKAGSMPFDPYVERRGRLWVDHDHDTGAVRGLLCVNCNIGIGKLSDSVAMLVKATAYLVERGGQ